MAGLNALFDKRKLALARARFHAWWEGEEFDEAAALAQVETGADEAAPAAAAEPPTSVEDELFDAPPFELPGRLQALGLLWGEGRIRPGANEAEIEVTGKLGLPAEGALAVLGPGLAAPLIAIASAHAGRIDVFEWREESFAALDHAVKEANLDTRISLTRIDLESHTFAQDAYDGLLSIDDFAYCSFPPHLAHQILKCLKPGAAAIVDCYAGEPSQALATAFASSFAEPQIRPVRDLVRVLGDTGMLLEAEEDLTEPFLAMARAGFKQLGDRLQDAGGLSVSAAQELAWEAEAWRARMTLLAQRRLERRRFVLRKSAETAPSGSQDPNANAPAG